MMIEFHNLLDVETPLGKGIAFMLESRDNDYFWNVILTETRAVVCFRQEQLLIGKNYSMGWGRTDEDMAVILDKFIQAKQTKNGIHKDQDSAQHEAAP